ncbi:MAG TPA: heme-binding domain-containing protein [Silvibacterium sp.]|nr:heme-binding domain-containing protein [Silvibacterium sp.]
MNPARIASVFGLVFAASLALSSVHPWGNPRSGIQPATPLLEGSAVPEDVRHVLATKCADCHSANTYYPAYSRLAPASWLIERDVHEGRSHLDMSQWQHYSLESQVDLLTRIASEARSGQMPVKQYLILHPKARLSPQEQQLIYDWAKAERKRIRKQLAEHQISP